MRRKLVYVIGIVVVAAAGVAYTLVAGNEPLLGLDLQGGASVVLEPTVAAEQSDLDVAVEIIRNRVDGLGVAEPEISTQGGNILVQLPGVDDQQRAIDLVGQTAELRFRPVIQVVSEVEYITALVTSSSASTAGPEVEPGSEEFEVTVTPGEGESGSGVVVEPVEPEVESGSEEFEVTVTPGEGESGSGVVVEPVEPEVESGSEEFEVTVTPGAGESDSSVVVEPVEPEVDPAPEIDSETIAALATVEDFMLTEGEPSADEEVVLAQYDEDRNIVARFKLGASGVAGGGLQGAAARYDSFTGWYVTPTFKSGDAGIDAFNSLALACFNRDSNCPTKRLAIEIDNEVVSAPIVQEAEVAFSPFERDNITISGAFSEQEAKDLALVLDYGALPIELEAQESRIVSASLGTDALEAGLIAGIIGLSLVSLYLLVYYRLLGLVAITSLALSGALLWTIISWLGESRGLALTLAGVTGLIVAIGVSVDSNVVYFEHLKEDVRSGRTVRSAVDRAFPVAFSTIVKADFASLIAAAVLYLLTTGQVKGFALYLGLATILDLVATYFFMGPVIGLIARGKRLHSRPGNFGIPAQASTQS